MLRFGGLLRCSWSSTRICLSSRQPSAFFPLAKGGESCDEDVQLSSSAELERAEAEARLSNEVFGRGNNHLKNVETLTALPEGLHSFPEVCFIGKPNCGKSSLISCLLHNSRLGKGGATGGSTRLLQFFNVGDALLLVDTPGYGGWKGRQLDQTLASRANAFSILFRYLALRKESNLKRVYWLMEASAQSPVSFQARDEELLAFLSRERIPFSVVLTKIDRHWRLYADRQRKTAVVGKDGLVRPGHAGRDGESGRHVPLPEEGVTRNMHEVFQFLGTDQVPILAVSANRKQPARSRNVELLQHDIVHYCVQDLMKGEALTLTNLHKLSYAPPSAEKIQEIQLRYPVESFVVPENNNLSLARMVERHEEMKAQFMARNVSAARLTARDAAACHLESIGRAVGTLEDEQTQRTQLRDVIPATTFLFEVPSRSTNAVAQLSGEVEAMSADPSTHAHAAATTPRTSVWRETPPMSPKEAESSTSKRGSRTFRRRPQLAGDFPAFSKNEAAWQSVIDFSSTEDERRTSAAHGVKPDAESEEATTISTLGQPLPTAFQKVDESIAPSATSTKTSLASHVTTLQERVPSSPALPAMIDPNTQYVTAIDGTRIPRSMISVSVEQLAVSKEDELTHFATKSGAGAYEELILMDHEGDAAADLFTEASDFSRLPEAAQDELLDARQVRTHSAAWKQEKRFLAKYVEKTRKERSLLMQAEGYMCPWIGVSEKREVVRGLQGSHTLGRGGAVLRDLKQKGYGGKSYSARTMKNRGRATKKTGTWAA